MEKYELNKDNYYSLEANKAYMSVSQFKDFVKCEAYALAKINGEWEDEKTDALLIGSYVDSFFAGEFNEFKENHPEIFNSRTGELKAQYAKADDLIIAITGDKMLYEFLKGKHQEIYTGEIAGVPFKGKFDSDFDDMIVDGKVMKDMLPVWVENEQGKNVKVSFIKAYGYDTQGAVYQELKRQSTGKVVPFVLDVITKEKVPSKALIQLEQEDMDIALEQVKELAPRYQRIKLGLEKPHYCGKCDYCKSIMKVDHISSSREFEPYDYSQEGE